MLVESTPCTYCGLPADSVDHVVPRHLLERADAAGLDLFRVFRMQRWTVPACRECNSIIGARIFKTLAERRAAAHKGIRKKYAALLRIPDWSEDDLAEMGPRAREDIRHAIRARDGVRERLRWQGDKDPDVRAVYDLAIKVARG